MARGQTTISDPLAELPPLVLEWHEPGGALLQRGKVYKRALEGFNVLGSAILKGPAHGSRFVWSCKPRLAEGAFALLDMYAELPRPYLLFSDEVEYVPMAHINGDRLLIPGSTANLRHEFSDGVTTVVPSGFVNFRALLKMPSEGPSDIVYSLTHEQRWKDFVFGIEELPEVVL